MVRTRRGATPVAPPPVPVVQPSPPTTTTTSTEVSGEGVVAVATANDPVQVTGTGGGEESGSAMDVDTDNDATLPLAPPEGEDGNKEQSPEVAGAETTTPLLNPPKEGSQPQDKETGTAGTAEKKVEAEEAEFVVLEEEDGGGEKDEDDDAQGEGEQDEAGNSEKKEDALSSAIDAVNLNENSTEMEQEGEKTENGETKSTPIAVGEGQQEQEDDVILVNPLFGKSSRPVIAVDSSSDSEEDDDEANNFQDSVLQHDSNCGGVDGNLEAGQGGADHGCNCFQEKGILIAEIERLRKAMGELGSRHSLLQDFIQVEYSEKFKTFLKNREHLMSMGFGVGADDTDLVDEKRSEKSAELVELLVMIKEQGSSKSKEDNASKSKSTPGNSSGSTFQKPVVTPSPSSQSKISSTPKGGRGSGSGGGTSSSRQSQRSKPIPSINSGRDREERDNTKVWDYPSSNPTYSHSGYPSRPDIEMVAHVRGGVPPPISLQDYQYQQQQVIAQQRQLQASAQSRYFDTMYANAVAGGGCGKDYTTTAVQRTNLFPSDPGNNVIGHKQERKRKRDSQGSSGSLNGSNNVPNPMARAQPLEVQMQGKKKCPICSAIMKHKKLKDHLIAFHNQVKMTCPVCREEFGMKRKLHVHMRDDHQLSEAECSSYAEKAYNNITDQIGVWLRKMMSEAKNPTREQMAAQLKFNDEQARLRNSGLTTSGTGRPAGSSSNAPSSSGGRIFTGSRGHFTTGGASATPSVDMYGPGGYAQYAARYLQQRTGAGTAGNRLYTPF